MCAKYLASIVGLLLFIIGIAFGSAKDPFTWIVIVIGLLLLGISAELDLRSKESV